MLIIDTSKGFDLGSFHFTVESDGKSSLDLDARDKYGEFIPISNTLRVSPQYGPDHYHVTFLHEVVEAVSNRCCNCRVKHDHITNLALGLAQIFKSMGIMFAPEKPEGHDLPPVS